MGMYTEIYINVNLRQEIPENVLATLQAIVDKDHGSIHLQDKPHRWFVLFNNGSFYTPYTECGSLTYEKISKQWSLIGKGDIKNYEGEIEAFFEWIMPWIDAEEGTFIGYSRYEESKEPQLYYKR